MPAEEESFPHSPHRRLECARCHTAVPHGMHGTADCMDCHPQPAWYAGQSVPSPRECLACHHDPDRARDCVSCHRTDE
ncbi:MAG: hypothetical protein GWN71_44780, partial [Gammaproteobacteria bacterium]|nr:hypothetical protein [Gemmatimonadota bacterium]NIR42337.1 hypothetical protein [Actinomycetota bacterium]NIU80402.1 hypothetical protein [Gammaproteobacteria bacterium]NIX25979.1 hypothetical protein [Actinomycetota bacterium]